MSQQSRCITFLTVACAMFACGCASVDLAKVDMPTLPMFEEKEMETPDRIIPVWTDSVLHRGGKAVRGFGGRVVFYGEEAEFPIQVDGVVIVYAWNDSKTNNQEKPDRKFVFKADMLPKHYSRSKIGDSYSFWLPWDKVGGTTEHVTLVTRFISATGGEVTSSAAHVVLPGPSVVENKAEKEQEPTRLDPVMTAKARLLQKARQSESIEPDINRFNRSRSKRLQPKNPAAAVRQERWTQRPSIYRCTWRSVLISPPPTSST